MVTYLCFSQPVRSAEMGVGEVAKPLRINVLGPFEVRSEDRVVALAGMKQRVLLSSLALSSRTAVPIGVLINMLWGEAPPATARAKVHAHVSEIRKALGGSHDGQHPGGWPVVTCQGGYQLSGDVDLDSSEFEIGARRARQALRLGQYAQGSGLFARALAMWRGPALADVESDAIQATAKALNEGRMLVIEGKAEADLQLGWYDEVVAELGLVAAANPLRERLRAELMLALYRRGSRNEALAAYRDAHQAMTRQLGLPPGPQLRRLQQFVYRDDPELWTQSPGDLLTMGATPGDPPAPPRCPLPAGRF
jgi:DNA-binding SARP family transcriptional activator